MGFDVERVGCAVWKKTGLPRCCFLILFSFSPFPFWAFDSVGVYLCDDDDDDDQSE